MDLEIKPNESDCCNSGCNPCILDVYEQQLKLHNQNKLPSNIHPNCISPTSYSIFELLNVENQCKNVSLYTFKYIRPLRNEEKYLEELCLQYEPGQHFLLKADFKGEQFTRAYTPIPIEDGDTLQFTTLIKLYKQGKMSNYLKTLKINNNTLWRGPYGEYKVNYNHKHLFLLAQGTGIAPIYSVIFNMISNTDCYTFIKLFFCCSDCNNIYLRDQLYNLSSNWNFTYEIFLSKNENVCEKYNEVIHNRLSCTDIQSYLVDKYENVYVLICGSDSFSECMTKYLKDCKVKDDDIFVF